MQKKNEELMYPTKFVWYKLVKIFLLVLLVSLFFWDDDWLGFILLSSFFIIIPYFLYIYLHYVNIVFSFDNNKIIKRWGIITKKSSIIHFDKIQNIDLKSGLLMRVFNLSSINIWTASQSQMFVNKKGVIIKPEISLFLDSFEAEELRVFMIDKEKRNQNNN